MVEMVLVGVGNFNFWYIYFLIFFPLLQCSGVELLPVHLGRLINLTSPLHPILAFSPD